MYIKPFLYSVDIIFAFFISMLADKLNMTPEEAERWIVNLIRNARLDAKIDSKLVSIVLAMLHTRYQLLFILYYFGNFS